MNTNKYDVLISITATLLICCLLLLSCAPREPSREFFSLNDGSLKCLTIKVPADITRDQLADALAVASQGARDLGCVNFDVAQ